VTAPSNNDAGTRPVTTYGYDPVGRVTAVTDALGHQTSYTYDNLDRVTSVTLPKPSVGSPLVFTTTYSYDNFDVVTGLVFRNTTDANGLITKHGFDQYGHLISLTDALDKTILYGYTRGLLTSITDANANVTSYSYDSGRRLKQTTFPDGAYESYTLTGDNLLSTRTDRQNVQTVYSYDALKRLVAKSDPHITLALTSYSYTGQKLTSVIDRQLTPNENHTFGYDSSYRLQQSVQGTRGSLSYTYNSD
jgi:YD repeat-containing protein